ncbi:hypothetical protein [Paraburkholderia caribensis]|uniref:hypothetical protein n=1 Tax=Paraburkholderia caribensis TaxID=75105 RepID=UPI001CAC3BF3|nr:hypothetical protein [Paraburkholderia caribensis]CAG9255967.1 conserved hypothetical protein [Paraburkholderia caribensis]
MGTTLDVILSGGGGAQHAAAESQTQEGQQTQPTEQQTQTTAATSGTEATTTGEQQTQTTPADGAATVADATGATPAPESGTMVPLKALEEERKGRQDWKEKAIRLEEELKHVRTQTQQAPAQQTTQATTQTTQQPQQLTYEQALLNERMNMSEVMVRQQHTDVDDMLTIFQKAAAENPALGAQLAQQRHPWQWMYEQAKRITAMEEIGSDPVAYRERIKAELKAEMEAGAQTAQTDQQATQQPAQQTPAAAAKPVIPQSLASARSAAPRTATTWTGPTPLNDILNSKR